MLFFIKVIYKSINYKDQGLQNSENIMFLISEAIFFLLPCYKMYIIRKKI
jgi:hypothetical protein